MHIITGFGKHAFKYYNINSTLVSNITKVPDLFILIFLLTVHIKCKSLFLVVRHNADWKKTMHFKVGIDHECLKSVNQSVSYLLAM